jgi:hypothetical protein
MVTFVVLEGVSSQVFELISQASKGCALKLFQLACLSSGTKSFSESH